MKKKKKNYIPFDRAVRVQKARNLTSYKMHPNIHTTILSIEYIVCALKQSQTLQLYVSFLLSFRFNRIFHFFFFFFLPKPIPICAHSSTQYNIKNHLNFDATRMYLAQTCTHPKQFTINVSPILNVVQYSIYHWTLVLHVVYVMLTKYTRFAYTIRFRIFFSRIIREIECFVRCCV